MDEQTAQALLADKGLSGTPVAWQRLVAGYAGNPLALKIVAQAVSDLFGGDLDRFLEEGELVFNGVRPVLRQQVGRLSPLEHLLLTWLAVLREWTTLHTLSQVLHPRVLRAQLLEALEALSRRSLVERGQQASFSLQSVVMEYLTDELGEQFSKEIVRGNPQHLRQVALAQAQAKDYVRQAQMRLLVQPLLERLRAELGTDDLVEARLLGLLAQFRAEDAATQGYGPANVITLLIALRGHLRGLDLSRLSIRGAYLQGVQMQDASLSGAILQECVWTSTFDAIIAVVTSLTGQYWAAGSKRGEVRVWRERGQILHLAWQAHTDQTYGLAFAPDGSLLASGGYEGTVRLWDPKLGTTLQELPHPGTVFSLAWSPDGHLLASGTLLQGVLLWDGTARSGRWVSRQLPTRLRRVAWSPDGTRLVGGGDDGHVYVWDAADGALLKLLAGHHGVVNSVAWSHDGAQLASGGGSQDSGELFVWDARSGERISTLQGLTGVFYAVAWHPVGKLLITGGSDGRLCWWDLPNCACVRVQQAHQGIVHALKVSPDDKRIASCGDDGAIHLWDLEGGEHLRTLRRDRPYERLTITDIRGLTQAGIATLRAQL